MHKEIEKAKFKIMRAMEKNRNEHNDARASYNDTGYNRYYKKMEKLDKEYEELKAFLNKDEKADVLPETVKELYDLREKLKNVKSMIEYVTADLPVSSSTIHLKELLMDIR